MESYYLSGTAHYLTAEQAEFRRQEAKGATHVKKENDGTFSIFYLSPTPIQPGQVKFQLPAK